MKTRIHILGAVLLAAVTCLTAAPLPPVPPAKEILRPVNPVGQAFSFMADAAPGTLKGPNERIWATRQTVSQLPYPACVGAAWSNWVNAAPAKRFNVREQFAIELWRWSVEHDQWPENGWDSGTDPYVASKRLKQLGYVDKLDQFGIQYEKDLRPVVLNEGPVPVAIPWYSSFDNPVAGSNGRGRWTTLSGEVRGGHFILFFGINQKKHVYYALQTWPGYGPYDKFNQVVEAPFDIVRRLFNRGGYGLFPHKSTK